MRKGLSYLEVLIAAGIALMGILGAVALYPVAIVNLQKGQAVDRMAAIGPSVLNSVGSLHVDEPAYWMPSAGVQPYDALCFDPRFVASVTTWDAAQSDPTLFPAIPQAGPLDARMKRMTLASGSIPQAAMTTAQARLMFKCQDDLLFDRPGDGTMPAQQIMLDNGTAQRRDYYADFEFVITAVPVVEFADRTNATIYNPANVTFHSTGEYELAAVVFNGRTPDLQTITLANGDATYVEDERLCDVAFLTTGYFGGEVTATLRPGRPTSDLNLVQSSWALVSGVQTVTRQPPPPPAVQTPAVGNKPVFHWYRVVAFSEIYGNQRDLSLEGPDWPANTSNLRITFVSGVTGVFTKPMRLK